MTFSELRAKDVINITDGKRLGRPIDIVLSDREADYACAQAIVVPGRTGFWKAMRAEREGCAIPWERIRRIGDDVILVDVDSSIFE